MSILYIIAALLVIAAIIFFARGGRIDVHVPDKWKKR